MKSLKFSLFAIATAMMISCSTNLTFDEVEDNLSYLSLPSGFKLNNVTKDGLKVLSEASKRIKIEEDENGLRVIRTKNAAEINVSEEVFQFYVQAIDNANKIAIKNAEFDRNYVISRSEGGYVEGFTGTMDCMAWALGAACSTTNYIEVSSYLLTKYNGAPPFSDALKIISHFHKGNVRKIDMIEPNALLGPDYIIIYKTGTNKSHAVNGMYLEGGYNSGEIMVADYQGHNIETGDEPSCYPIKTTEILAIYKLD